EVLGVGGGPDDGGAAADATVLGEVDPDLHGAILAHGRVPAPSQRPGTACAAHRTAKAGSTTTSRPGALVSVRGTVARPSTSATPTTDPGPNVPTVSPPTEATISPLTTTNASRDCHPSRARTTPGRTERRSAWRASGARSLAR